MLVSAILNLPTSGYIGQYRRQCHSVPGPRKHRLCRLNFDAISSRSRDISSAIAFLPLTIKHGTHWNVVAILSRCRYLSISGVAAAILHYRVPVTPDSIYNSTIEFLPQNIDVAKEYITSSCTNSRNRHLVL